MNKKTPKMIPVRTEVLENTQARKINVTRIKRMENYYLLRIRKRMLCKCNTQDCEVLAESETAPPETVPLTEVLMQIEVLRGGRDFETKDFVALKDKGLVLAT